MDAHVALKQDPYPPRVYRYLEAGYSARNWDVTVIKAQANGQKVWHMSISNFEENKSVCFS